MFYFLKEIVFFLLIVVVQSCSIDVMSRVLELDVGIHFFYPIPPGKKKKIKVGLRNFWPSDLSVASFFNWKQPDRLYPFISGKSNQASNIDLGI